MTAATGPLPVATTGALPRVAVIVPAFDAAPFLAETLESVLAQTYAAWECIVVDDGSTDETAAIAGRFVDRDARFRLVRQPNAGVSDARNTGLDAISADVTLLGFLDSDDTWVPDALGVLVASFDGDDAVLGVYGTAEYMDSDGAPIRPGAHSAAQSDRRRLGRIDLVGLREDELSTWSSMMVSGTIWPSAVGLHRRGAVERAGRFDPVQKYVEDWDLYIRMSRHGSFKPVHRQVAWYRQHTTNLTKRSETMAYFDARLRWNAWRSGDNTGSQQREAQRIWRRLQLRRIYWSAGAVAAGVRDRDLARARDATRAVSLFGRQLLGGHPVAPDVESARLLAKFVMPRSAGKGMTDG